MKQKKVRVGGADTYSLRSATLVEGYFPGAMRQNFLQDPIYRTGEINFGTFGNDQNYNGPGSLMQALPDASRYQNKVIFEPPRPTTNKEFGLDDRQLASYQVQQLNNNPLSQYTTKPNDPIPSFMCNSQPSNYSTMINKRDLEYEKWFKDLKPNNYTDASPVPGRSAGSAQNVYQQYSGEQTNPNANIVYNMSLNSEEEYNPMISMGSSNVSVSQPVFSNLCYSNNYRPGYVIGTNSGSNPGIVYGPNKGEPKTVSEIGFMNPDAYKDNQYCVPNKEINFANSLVL